MSNFYRKKSALECFYEELNLLKNYMETKHTVKNYGIYVELEDQDNQGVSKHLTAFAGPDLDVLIGQIEILKNDMVREYYNQFESNQADYSGLMAQERSDSDKLN